MSDESQTLWSGPDSPQSADFREFDFPHLYPSGYTSSRVNFIPGTTIPLDCAWRIYIDNGRLPAPPNACILKKFGIEWTGNVIVSKHRRGSSNQTVSITTTEEEFANVILGLYGLCQLESRLSLLLSSSLREFVHLKTIMGVEVHFKSE
ncbi:hypothetical protein B0H16DRAFT_1460657 [Mycena metata]|uniref:Uncharacterized protein n=1 Tax=Mycena metata TaxID=1033252 RepID=A0AAD7IXA1_9AGAR|nr:hypothetical protein B0H16DRAFT_1460657 [Mycena metata]